MIIENMSNAKEDNITTAKIGMWLFLFTELLLFAVLFIIYAVYRFLYKQSFHTAAEELNVLMGMANTIVLLTSSLTLVLSVSAIHKNKKKSSEIYLIITILLGMSFLVNKYFEWGAKIHHGIYPNSPALLKKENGEILFFGLYYVMTGLHGLHVVIGILLLAVMLGLVHKNKINKDNFVKLENSGLYWHFVDIIWIFLFPLLYLIT